MKNCPTILVINPGSTSTKTAIFAGDELTEEENLQHVKEELEKSGPSIIDQLAYRAAAVENFLTGAGTSLAGIDCIMARGGLLKPLPGGVYRINQEMLEDLRQAVYGSHASNLGALIADRLSRKTNPVIPAYIADPVVVDELGPLARYAGHPAITRRSAFHALNQKAVCRAVARDTGKNIEESVFIIAHMGGGISVAVHENGKVTDLTNALDGEGPFTPERAGALPVLSFMKYAEEKGIKYTEGEIMINRQGGLLAYCGSNDFMALEEKSHHDPATREVVEAMAYQISKAICALAAVTCGRVDGIALTGGLANSRLLTGLIRERVSFLAPVHLYARSSEMEALASRGAAVLAGQEQPRDYPAAPEHLMRRV